MISSKLAAWFAIAAMGSVSLAAEAPSVTANSAKIAIVGVRIIPADDRKVITDGVILIEDTKIQAAGSRNRTAIPTGYKVLDWSGLTVLPGYWNAHVHLTTPAYLRAPDLSDAELETELTRTFTRWGFTTVFDLASTTRISSNVSQRVDSGAVKGPKVLSVAEPFYPAGGTPIYARPFYEAFKLPSAEVADAPAADARARTQIRDGADGLKLFTFAHPTNKAGLELAAENRVDVLAHAVPLMGSWTPAYARSLAARHVAMIPTLSLFALEPHPLTPVGAAVQQTRALHSAGGTILFGTDAGFTDQFSPEQEMLLLEEAVGWRGVIAALTSAPARLFGDARTEGRLGKGYVADLVAVGCDPERNIRCLADVRRVMRDGDVIHAVK
jgi:imidazolonepropionase-like amidohydrolase